MSDEAEKRGAEGDKDSAEVRRGSGALETDSVDGKGERGGGEGDSAEATMPRPHSLAYEQARLAYTIIQALLEHTRVTQDLVALMAQALGEETQEALVNTPHWAAYMDSRRTLERTREDVEKFAEVWTRLAEELEPPPTS